MARRSDEAKEDINPNTPFNTSSAASVGGAGGGNFSPLCLSSSVFTKLNTTSHSHCEDSGIDVFCATGAIPASSSSSGVYSHNNAANSTDGMHPLDCFGGIKHVDDVIMESAGDHQCFVYEEQVKERDGEEEEEEEEGEEGEACTMDFVDEKNQTPVGVAMNPLTLPPAPVKVRGKYKRPNPEYRGRRLDFNLCLDTSMSSSGASSSSSCSSSPSHPSVQKQEHQQQPATPYLEEGVGIGGQTTPTEFIGGEQRYAASARVWQRPSSSAFKGEREGEYLRGGNGELLDLEAFDVSDEKLQEDEKESEGFSASSDVETSDGIVLLKGHTTTYVACDEKPKDKLMEDLEMIDPAEEDDITVNNRIRERQKALAAKIERQNKKALIHEDAGSNMGGSDSGAMVGGVSNSNVDDDQVEEISKQKAAKRLTQLHKDVFTSSNPSSTSLSKPPQSF
eukprot:Nk52_evm65s212 gene=Nk52_evmTU65s212